MPGTQNCTHVRKYECTSSGNVVFREGARMPNDDYTRLIEFLGRKFEDIDRRFDRLDAKLAEHDERFREVFGHFDHLYRRLEPLEQEYQAILEASDGSRPCWEMRKSGATSWSGAWRT